MGRKTKHQKRYENSGRPTKMDALTIQKLEDAFSNSFPDDEACLYAGISESTLYNYQKKNPLFVERKVALKLTPNLKARRTVVNALDDPNFAWRWLERKDKSLMPASKVEHEGKIQTEDVSQAAGVAEAIKQYEETRDKQIKEEARNMK